jgi:acetyl-CoA carboxylase biotin carboxylase subunit
MGIQTVALFSDADRTSMHVRMADEAFSLAGNTPSETYLRQDLVMDAAKQLGVDAIHPGYGFLSENPAFAEKVEASGLKFIGPPASAIRALGDKTAARKIADELGIPTVPGTREAISEDSEATRIAAMVGYPILLKAAAGGGGKGMRIVKGREELAEALLASKSEARNAFGDDRVYIEKYLEHPRHVEIQVLADGAGNTIFLGERECSIQRRHQKVMEETPSPIVDETLRSEMGLAAVRLIRSVGYRNAGTVEFLVDENKKFYFLEVNTRLQVEHPITELVTGIDLIQQQILMSDGQELSLTQDEVSRRGHAIECRICAEDPENNFFPSTGILKRYSPPHGPRVRVDTGFCEGDRVTIFYDPLMAKVITWGQNRGEAMEGMRRALDEFTIQGVESTVPFCLFVLSNERFLRGKFDTSFVDEEFRPGIHQATSERREIAASVAAALIRSGAWLQNTETTNHQGGDQSAWKKQRLESYR